MEKFDVKLIAIDMDDTLLNKNLEITPKNIETLQKVAEKGIYVVLCSGRIEVSLIKYVEKLNLLHSEYGRYIIAINGVTVYDIQKNSRILFNSLPGEILIKSHEISEQNGLHSQVYSADTIYYGTYDQNTQLDLDLCKDAKGELVPNYTEIIKNSWAKMLIPCDPKEPERLKDLQIKLKKEIGDKADVIISKPYFLEILPKNCNKGSGIKFLAEKLGISLDKTMCFGDASNDESMIKTCKYGVVMKNGLDYLKKITKYVTYKTNEEDGVADYLEKHVL